MIEAAGTKPKLIEEFVGGPSTGTTTGSVARMITAPGEWVRYSTPHPDGAEYVAICLSAFSPTTVHRDA